MPFKTSHVGADRNYNNGSNEFVELKRQPETELGIRRAVLDKLIWNEGSHVSKVRKWDSNSIPWSHSGNSFFHLCWCANRNTYHVLKTRKKLALRNRKFYPFQVGRIKIFDLLYIQHSEPSDQRQEPELSAEPTAPAQSPIPEQFFSLDLFLVRVRKQFRYIPMKTKSNGSISLLWEFANS